MLFHLITFSCLFWLGQTVADFFLSLLVWTFYSAFLIPQFNSQLPEINLSFFIITSKWNNGKLLVLPHNLLAHPSFTPPPVHKFHSILLSPHAPWVSCPFLNPAFAEIVYTFTSSFLNHNYFFFFSEILIWHFFKKNHLSFGSNTHTLSFFVSFFSDLLFCFSDMSIIFWSSLLR